MGRQGEVYVAQSTRDVVRVIGAGLVTEVAVEVACTVSVGLGLTRDAMTSVTIAQ